MTSPLIIRLFRRALNIYRGVLNSESTLNLILTSELLDLSFYNLQLSSQINTRREAVQHYLAEGEAAGLNPNAFFDVEWYYSTYKDLSDSSSALIDFISRAPEYDRNPSQGFDCRWYLQQYPDVFAAGINPLRHYMVDGYREGRLSSPFKMPAYAPIRNVDLARAAGPSETETTISGRFDVKSIPIEQRQTGTWEAAAAGSHKVELGSRANTFPPRPYTAVFQKVAVVGGTRLVISDTNSVYSDEIAAFRDSPGWSVRPHDYKIGSSGKLLVALNRRYPSHIARGAHLMHEYASNYFHMITELLPRLIAAEDAGLPADLPLLIQAGLHPNLLELLGVINQRNRQLLPLCSRQIYTVEELHFISDVASIQDVYDRERRKEETVLHHGLTKIVAERVIAALAPGPAPERTRRLYIRRGGRYRGLLNEQAVEEMLIAQGFEVVLMDGLSITAQILLFRQARLVVAPTGAAVTNILWCQPTTSVCVLSAKHEAMPNEIWVQLGEVSGCSVVTFTCERAFDRDDIYSMHDNYVADLERLNNKIAELSASDSPHIASAPAMHVR